MNYDTWSYAELIYEKRKRDEQLRNVCADIKQLRKKIRHLTLSYCNLRGSSDIRCQNNERIEQTRLLVNRLVERESKAVQRRDELFFGFSERLKNNMPELDEIITLYKGDEESLQIMTDKLSTYTKKIKAESIKKSARITPKVLLRQKNNKYIEQQTVEQPTIKDIIKAFVLELKKLFLIGL